MLAVETGEWDEARGKIDEAKALLARAGLCDGQPSGLFSSPEREVGRKVGQLSEMVHIYHTYVSIYVRTYVCVCVCVCVSICLPSVCWLGLFVCMLWWVAC